MNKKIFSALVSALCLFVGLAVLRGQAEAAPRLTVRAFDNKTGRGSFDAPSQAITDMMTTELYNSGMFSLMEREKLDYIAEELRLSQSGLMDPDTAPELGRIKGAQYTMTGAITQYRYNASGGFLPIPGVGGGGIASGTALATLDIRILDNTTGEVVYAAAQSGTAKREVKGLVTKYGGFGSASYGGILAAATREAVMAHVSALEEYEW